MAGAVGSVAKVVELALKIKDAVDTVRQNRKDCAHIRRRVERVRHTLSLCEGNTELMESPAVRGAVEALAEVLGEALELVTGCQEETNAVCLCCTAGKLSKQLGKVDRGISDGNSEATFAILVYYISKQAGNGARPALPTEPEEEENTIFMLQEIANIALTIRTAMATVHRNKDECVQIDKLASRASVVLSQLEYKETMKDTAVRSALKSLLCTFRHAHEVVAACQRRSVVLDLCSPGKLSAGELRGVLDEMMIGLDQLIDVLCDGKLFPTER